MTRDDIQDIHRRLFSIATSSSPPFLSSATITTATATANTSLIFPQYSYNNQNPTTLGENPFSQLLSRNNINQTIVSEIDWQLHGGRLRGFPAVLATTSSMNYYSSQDSSFQNLSLYQFLSGNNRSQITDNVHNWDVHGVLRTVDSTARSSSSAINAANNDVTITPNVYIELYNQQQSTFQRQEITNMLQSNFIETQNESFQDSLCPFESVRLEEAPSVSQISSTPPLLVPRSQDPVVHIDHRQQLLHETQQSFGITICTSNHAKSTTRSTKRKDEIKRIFQVPYKEKISSRYWRKYGQKPIKGSPYPRGYYRCSARENCLARKKVERKKTDPNILIITYTGEHNHPTSPSSAFGGDHITINPSDGSNNNNKFTSVSPVSPTGPPPELVDAEIEGIDDEVFSYGDVFDGLDEIVDLAAGNISFNDQMVVPASSLVTLSSPGNEVFGLVLDFENRVLGKEITF